MVIHEMRVRWCGRVVVLCVPSRVVVFRQYRAQREAGVSGFACRGYLVGSYLERLGV